MSSPSDQKMKKIIERASQGDDAAITRLYEMHLDRIARYIAYRVPDSDVEDLTAEVFVRMIEGLPNFVYTGAPFEAWLYKIAQARVADYHRARSRHPEEDMPDNLEAPQQLPEERLLRDHEFATVRKALDELNDDERDLLLLRFVERKSHREVADLLDKSEAATRTMQHRALTKLADLLEADGKERHYLRGRKAPESSPSDS